MAAFIEAMDLRGATLVGQDWGGLIGLRLVAEHPDRFERVVAANTFLPTGDMPPGEAFLRWQTYSQETPNFHVGGIIRRRMQDRALGRSGRSIQRSVPGRYVQGRRPAVPASGPHSAGRSRVGRESRGLGSASRLGKAVSLRVQRSGPGNPGRGQAFSSDGAGDEGTTAHDNRRRGSLPAGGQG